MKSCYIHEETRSILDIYETPTGFLMISRINVPKAFRSQGHASRLLDTVLADADKEGKRLGLVISPSDGLNFRQLKSWYERRGFKKHSKEGCWIREPNII